jgi:hypothetical protein
MNKGGVAEPLQLGSYVDAITVRLTRYLLVVSGRSRSVTAIEGDQNAPPFLSWVEYPRGSFQFFSAAFAGTFASIFI